MALQVRYLIIGGGVAGYNAAQAIRTKDASGRILIAAAEKELPYNRPMLTKLLEQPIPREKLLIKSEDWYKEKEIDIQTNLRIVSVDVQQHSAATQEGDTILFEKLILAMGATCFVPPIEGAQQEHVFTVRDVEDVRHIDEMLPGVHDAVVIGGGVLGLEAAWSLTRYGIHVTIIEQAERVMRRQLDEDASSLMLQAIESHGTRFLASSGVQCIARRSVLLTDGQELPADIVLISTGIRSTVEPARDIPGLHIGRAIRVNDYMETGAADVYACGDCAELDGRVFGLWQPSGKMGQTAGLNAAGTKSAFEELAVPMLFNGYETSLCVVGDVGYDPSRRYETETLIKTEHELEKLWFCNGVLTGVCLVGNTKKSAFYKKAVAEKMSKESLQNG